MRFGSKLDEYVISPGGGLHTPPFLLPPVEAAVRNTPGFSPESCLRAGDCLQFAVGWGSSVSECSKARGAIQLMAVVRICPVENVLSASGDGGDF